METINNLATTASKAIWGDKETETSQTGPEPVAGEQGKGTTTDPYDHGNAEEKEIPKDNVDNVAKDNENLTTEPKMSSDPTTSSKDFNNPPTSGTDTSAENRPGPSDATSGPETGDPKSAQQPTHKQQGADKPGEEPSDSPSGIKMPHSDKEREELMQKGEFPHDPNDHSGEPMKMHDGAEAGKKQRSDSVAQEGGAPHGSSKGTGTEYVKSSGLAADGGDFDVTKPGAGMEATRLMEEKGIHKTGDNHGAPAATDEVDSKDAAAGPKVSKIDKIKEKLHLKH